MIAENLKSINERIANALAKANRPADSARLLAVSKTFPADIVREAMPRGFIPSIHPNCSHESIASPPN